MTTGTGATRNGLPGAQPLARITLAAATALALLWCVASLWFPFGWDQGIMASVGDAVVRGGMPYRDAWDMKGPLSFYAFAVAQWIFGRAMWAIRVFDVLLLLAACVVMARMVGRLTSSRVGAWAAVALALWYASLSWFFVSQPDGWVALLAVLAIAPLSRRPDLRLVPMLWCGVAIGCCALIKPFYAALLLVPLVFIASAPAPISRRGVALGVTGAAAALPVLLMLAWFARQGALDSLLEVHFGYSRAYAGTFGLDPFLRRIFNYFWSTGTPTPAGAVAVALPAVGLGVIALWTERRQLALTFGTWLVVALGCVAIQGKFWVYHWVPTFPPFIVLGAVGLWKLAGTEHDRWAPGKVVGVLVTLLFFAQIAVSPALDVGRWVQRTTGLTTASEYNRRHFRRFYVAEDNIEAARHIRSNTSETDGVVVWGNDATIGFLSGRPNPTRFVFAMPLTREQDDSVRAAYRREYMADLTTTRPVYIVIGQPHDGSSDKQAVLQAFPELDRLLRERYRLERQIGFLDLYRRAE